LETPLISVIIATHNSEPFIERCLLSLTSQSYPRENFEIIIVDDGSNDKSVELSRKNGADKVIETEPCTLGKARNIGAQEARGKFFTFFDSDCIAKDGWVKTIAKELEKNDAISGPVLNGNTQSLMAWADYLLEFSEFNEHKKRSIINFMPGCNQACTREAFEKTEGFPDKRLSDDVYFGFLLNEAGKRIVFVPEFKMYHLCRTELKKLESNQELLGRYFFRTIGMTHSSYDKLIKSRWYIPGIFFLKIGSRAKHAVRAKKTCKFLITLPIIIIGVFFWCKGLLKEFNEQS